MIVPPDRLGDGAAARPVGGDRELVLGGERPAQLHRAQARAAGVLHRQHVRAPVQRNRLAGRVGHVGQVQSVVRVEAADGDSAKAGDRSGDRPDVPHEDAGIIIAGDRADLSVCEGAPPASR